MTTDALGEGAGGTRWNAPGTSGPGDRSLAEERRPIVGRERIVELRSNVYRTNRLSMAFHRKLGFRITQENEKGVEFVASAQDLRVSGALRTDCRLRSIVAMSSTTGDQ